MKKIELIETSDAYGKTGIEIGARTGVSIGLLTIYDMVKAIDKSIRIEEIVLIHKSRGKPGELNKEKRSHKMDGSGILS